MKDDSRDYRLNELLYRWHAKCRHDPVGRGYAPKALVVGEFRISRQYDDTNGALDEALDNSEIRAVSKNVYQMEDPWKSAIHVTARNLYTGWNVWNHPRLPADKREQIVAEARVILTRRLVSDGVM